MTRTLTKGQAKVGDVVHYFDMANQNGETYTVVDLPVKADKTAHITSAAYWGCDYALIGDETGELTISDLRQHGWTTITD